jgi:5-keto-L-gluconate epimerase
MRLQLAGREWVSAIKVCLFSTTPDLAGLKWAVRPLIGSPQRLAQQAVEWGYDGIELMPNPDRLPDSEEVERALKDAGAVMPVVSSAVIYFQGMALLHLDSSIRRRALQSFKRILDFAGYFKANVGLGAARGAGVPNAAPGELESMAEDVFRELAQHAGKTGAVIMLEPAEPGYSSFINTMKEGMDWVQRIGSPSFTLMLDTYQLAESESSFEDGIRTAKGKARHIHLYEPSHWPPGVLPAMDRYDWPNIAKILSREGFRGSGSVCLVPEGDPEPVARQASAYLRQLFNGDA